MTAATKRRTRGASSSCRVAATIAAFLIPTAATGLFSSGRPADAQEVQPAASSRKVVTADRTARNLAYSPGVLAGNTLYLSGHLGEDPATQGLPAGIRDQTRQAMDNIGGVLRAAGLGYEHLVKCHVYLASMDDYAGMNETYRGYFPDRVPARTTIEAAGLPRGAAVQISCVAYGDLAGISVVRPPAGSLPAPLGPYSAAVWAGDTLYLSGMGGQFPDGRPLPTSLGGQVTQTLANIGTTLKAAGLGYADVVAGQAYLTAPDEANTFEGAYRAPFASPVAHAHGAVFVPRLPGGIKAELTMIASRSRVARRAVPAEGKSDAPIRAMRAGDVLYTRLESAEGGGRPFEEQYRHLLDRQEATLRAAGLSWSDVVDVRIYLSDLADMEALDRTFRARFPQDPPARTIIRVISGGARIQSSLIGVRPGASR